MCFELHNAQAEQMSVNSQKMPAEEALIRCVFLKHSSKRDVFKITDIFPSFVDDCCLEIRLGPKLVI